LPLAQPGRKLDRNVVQAIVEDDPLFLAGLDGIDLRG
jgi:hypothetical protein